MNKSTALTAAITSLATLFATSVTTVGEQTAEPAAAVHTTGTTPAANAAIELLGSSPSQVIEAFGTPASVMATGQSLTFVYRRKTGDEPALVLFHDDVVIQAPPAEALARGAAPSAMDAVWLGQPAAMTALNLGSPEEVSLGNSSCTAYYGSGLVVHFAHGRVIGVSP